MILLAFGSGIDNAAAAGPSFDCNKAAGMIEKLICGDDGLAALDRKLVEVYADASKKAVNEHPPILKAEQRGWIKGRNDCWKSKDARNCTESLYRERIAELQARYRLVPENGPFWFICDGNPRNELIVTFFRTDPPTLIAERADQVSIMHLQSSGSGSKYQGRNEMFWEHQGLYVDPARYFYGMYFGLVTNDEAISGADHSPGYLRTTAKLLAGQ